MNIGDNSPPEKLALVSPDGPNTENPMKTGCLTDSRSEPKNLPSSLVPNVILLAMTRDTAATKPEMPIRILCVEDHPVFREGLCTIIGSQNDMALVAQASTTAEAMKEFRAHRPDVTLMDLRLPGANGVDAIVAIRGECPDARIIVLTSAEGDAEIQRALRAGAAAYVLKSLPQDELLAIIRAVHTGKRHVPADVAIRLAEHLGDEALTPRELDVLRLIRDGSKNKEIAARLGISEATVNFHIKNLVSKLHANDRSHALTVAIRRGILQI